ncbi:hypothetical protein [Thiococcus pfennigii]|jgi:hypothetical protein|uniref:hypothetical protein n=1 Tax=Thiococcus pfennigii TaxID=1057 RepID=UPI00190300BE|nr:hypothetical protein [Thiococcus pfennigii]MBK1699993.1 hypothetical protein [Thiococcus pfennigii]MBK1730882.1 hypothetical protein [Thiococcus pfennigii]
MEQLRTPFLILALALAASILMIQLGAAALPAFLARDTPGLGIPYLALYDAILLYSLVLMALALVAPARLQGRLQGIVSLVFFLVLLVAGVLLVLVALAKLILMVSLFLAVPFGTIAYLAAYADFPVGVARATLGILMTLKLAMVVSLLLAHQRFLENKGLVILIAISLLLNLLVVFLHALVPSLLVSILDAAAAILVGLVAAIWALLGLFGSLMAVVKALKVRLA